MNELIDKAKVLLEALPYIQRFSGATFVVKYGGSFMDSEDPSIREAVARDIVFLEAVEINPVVVHGGGKEAHALGEGHQRIAIELRISDAVANQDALQVD